MVNVVPKACLSHLVKLMLRLQWGSLKESGVLLQVQEKLCLYQNSTTFNQNPKLFKRDLETSGLKK